MENKVSLTLSFTNLEELQIFCNKFATPEPVVVEKPKDLRGSKTKYLHQLARDVGLTEPEWSYKTCLKEAGKQLRDKNKK